MKSLAPHGIEPSLDASETPVQILPVWVCACVFIVWMSVFVSEYESELI